MNSSHHPDNNTHGMGKMMYLIGIILALVLLTWLFAGVEESIINPNQQLETYYDGDGGREVVLQRNRYGHYVLDGKINGQTVTFLLDTGATDVSIPGNLADRLGLKRGRSQQYRTANGTIIGYQTRIDSLKLGEIELRDVRASINPQERGSELLLGMSVLKNIDFSQRGDTLTLRQN